MKYKKQILNHLIINKMFNIPISVVIFYFDSYEKQLIEIQKNIKSIGYDLTLIRILVLLNENCREELFCKFIERFATLSLDEISIIIDEFINKNCIKEFKDLIEGIYDK